MDTPEIPDATIRSNIDLDTLDARVVVAAAHLMIRANVRIVEIRITLPTKSHKFIATISTNFEYLVTPSMSGCIFRIDGDKDEASGVALKGTMVVPPRDEGPKAPPPLLASEFAEALRKAVDKIISE